MMIITIVKYSEYIYIYNPDDPNRRNPLSCNLTLNFQNCVPFMFLRERQFSSERPTFLKIPIAQNLSVTEQFKTCILKRNCTRIPNLSLNLRLEHYL